MFDPVLYKIQNLDNRLMYNASQFSSDYSPFLDRDFEYIGHLYTRKQQFNLACI